MTKLLNRDDILGAQDIVTEEVDVPQWGGSVLVRGMTGTQRNAFEKAITKEKPAGNRAGRRNGQTTKEVVTDEVRQRLVLWCVVDDSGQRLFAEADLPAIADKAAAAIEKIVVVAMRLSGMDEDDVDKLAEEMIDNPSDDSSSP